MSHDLGLFTTGQAAASPAHLGRARSVRLWIEATVSLWWLARTLQSARRCAGRCVTAHAELADIDALAHLLGVVIVVLLCNAGPLLIGVFWFF